LRGPNTFRCETLRGTPLLFDTSIISAIASRSCPLSLRTCGTSSPPKRLIALENATSSSVSENAAGR
jgi:hypothetical protein